MPKAAIIASVMSIYGCEMTCPPTSSSTTSASAAYGAQRSTADTYWLLTLASSVMRPPLSPFGAIDSGRHPSPSRYSMLAPLARKATTKGPIGRCFIRAFPVTTVRSPAPAATNASGVAAAEPDTSAHTAVRKRAAVPALPRKSSAPAGGAQRRPPVPRTTSVAPPSSHANSAPCALVSPALR
jgi:hypothetical protein